MSLFAQTGAQQIGGSNYVTYDLGNYAGQVCDPSTVKSVLGTYNENPALVEQQLQQMYAAGQRKISLVLFAQPQSGTAISGLCVDSSSGRPSS